MRYGSGRYLPFLLGAVFASRPGSQILRAGVSPGNGHGTGDQRQNSAAACHGPTAREFPAVSEILAAANSGNTWLKQLRRSKSDRMEPLRPADVMTPIRGCSDEKDDFHDRRAYYAKLEPERAPHRCRTA